MNRTAKISAAFTAGLWLKTFPVILLSLVACSQQMLGQVVDDFSDGNFVADPPWDGETEKFTVDAQALRLTAPAIAGSAFLSVPSRSFYDAIWEFTVRMEFNPSSGNYTRVYIASDQPDLRGALNGYFVVIGDSPDEVSLYRQAGAAETKIIDGEDGSVDVSPVDVKVKVVRDRYGNWELFSDVDGAGFVSEGVAKDVVHSTTAYFGVLCTFSATRSDKFFFDDIHVTGVAFVDLLPPEVDSVKVTSPTELEVTFSETVTPETAGQETNYTVADAFPDSAFPSADSLRVRLVFENAFENGVPQTLQVTSISDREGNLLASAEVQFLYFESRVPVRHDVIFTELFPDPTPPTGLPETEFVEIHNRAEVPFEMTGWKFADAGDTVDFQSFILLPEHDLILCSGALETTLETFGDVMGLSRFPSLNNASDQLLLLDPTGAVIDSVGYSKSWYRDEEKEDGGFSIELINTGDFCSGDANWTASTADAGGTPGMINSVYDTTSDRTGPKLLAVNVISRDTIAFAFDERLDSALPGAEAFAFEPEVAISAVAFGFDSNVLLVTLQEALDSTITYAISLASIFDCPGNVIREEFSRGQIKLDTVPPLLNAVNVISERALELRFSESLDLVSSASVASYETLRGGRPATAELLAGNTVRLTFTDPFGNGVADTLVISGLRDAALNEMSTAKVKFMYFHEMPAEPRDVIITEIMCDPVPVVGLPEAEFIELHNRSDGPFDLTGWTLSDGNRTATLPTHIIRSGEYVLLSGMSGASALAQFGHVLAVATFPSLNNGGESLMLRADDGTEVDVVDYSDAWYRDDDKRDGGWTLERIDPHDACRGPLNWAASNDPRGGTPAVRNSVYNDEGDHIAPVLVGVEVSGRKAFRLRFDEKLEATLPPLTAFDVLPPLGIDSLWFSNPGRSEIMVQFRQPVDSSTTYLVTVNGVRDCPGNLIDPLFASATVLLDTLPPRLHEVKAVDERVLTVEFSESVPGRPESVTFFDVDGMGFPVSVSAENARTIRLEFQDAFENGQQQTLRVHSVTDLAGNVMLPSEATFLFFEETPVTPDDIVVSEIFSDPTPVRGLPEAEYIEIYNRTTHPFNLAGWTLSDETGFATLSQFIILPHEYALLCAHQSVGSLSRYGRVLGVTSFPSLNNASDEVVISDAHGQVVDSVRYHADWYRDDEKADGGWSLEIIDPENLCSEGPNWVAAEVETGGTPGARNSVFANKPDLTGPKLLVAFPLSDSTIVITFNEKLEKTLPAPDAFEFQPAVSVAEVSFVDQSLTAIHARLSEDLQGGIAYALHGRSIYDCAGNIIDDEFDRVSFALPEEAIKHDLVINEVLFNPTSTGVDFVEVYNRSGKFIDLKEWRLANLSGDTVTTGMTITTQHVLLPPKAYRVFTEDGNLLKGEYLSGREETFFEADLPPLPDDRGSVVLVDDDGRVVDQVVYAEDFHSAFVRDGNGISLERIGFDVSASDASNWKSASRASGYATPGYLNSNSIRLAPTSDAIVIEPEVFVPGTGQPDFSLIRYAFDRGNLIANVRILNARGQEVRRLANNVLIGTEGFFRWDGDLDNGMRAGIGTYMVWVEVFDETGFLRTFRKRVVVAGDF